MFSSERIIALAPRFVPAADEVWRLQRGDDADCLFFQRAINRGEPITDGGTRQGVYAFAPSGKLLGRINSNNADRVAAMLARALEAWDALPEAERALPPDAALAPVHRWEHAEPADGLVLERYARDLESDGTPRRAWNRDIAWFSRAEVATLVPPDPRVGSTYRLPRAFAVRLARYHLLDNARGQTIPFAPGEVARAHVRATVTARDGDVVTLALEGATRARSDGEWTLGDNLWKPRGKHPHGIETRLLGDARFDLAAGSFLALDLVAVARRFGRTDNNGRGRDASPGLLAFHLTLAPTTPRVAPTFVALYDADWIPSPPSKAELARDR